MDMLKFCSTCRRVNQENFHGYIAWVEEDCYECPICGDKMIDTSISVDEYYIIDKISDEVNFLEAMIKLKEDDIIEYQLRMSRFRTQVQQQDDIKQLVEEKYIPRCPNCNSPNVQPISSVKSFFSIALGGIFSNMINKTYECNDCGYTW